MQQVSFLKNYRLILGVAFLLLFGSCELFLGEGQKTTVMIDLGEAFGIQEARSISLYNLSKITLSVFGEGMEPFQQTVSPSARYLTLTVPSGKQRHFTLEIFFAEPPTERPHVLSLKGRTIADLKPNEVTKLVFRMVAGSTALLVPDYGRSSVFQAPSLASFIRGEYYEGNLGYQGLFPADLDYNGQGVIFVSRYLYNSLVFANNIYGDGRGEVDNLGVPYSLAIDRDLNMDIDKDEGIDSQVIYLANLRTNPDVVTDYFAYIIFNSINQITVYNLTLNTAGFPSIKVIRGIAVDPWTHHLYLVGVLDETDSPSALIEYDPTHIEGVTNIKRGRIIRVVKDSRFRTLNDVLVKDKAIYVLNEISVYQPQDPNLPVIFQFNRDLKLVKTFGTVSRRLGGGFEASIQTGKFYYPKRFIAQENYGLYILDDSDLEDKDEKKYDKIIYLNEDLSPASWRTFPNDISNNESNEPFNFFIKR